MHDNQDLRSETAAARQLVEAMQAHGFDGEDISISVESETNFAEAVSAAVRRLDELEQLASGAKSLADRYKTRAAVLEEAREVLRGSLAEALERAGVPLPMRLPVGTVGLQTVAPSAIVTDEDLIPDEFWKVKTSRSIDMRALTASLRDGFPVDGAVLRNSRKSVAVRR